MEMLLLTFANVEQLSSARICCVRRRKYMFVISQFGCKTIHEELYPSQTVTNSYRIKVSICPLDHKQQANNCHLNRL